jgi:hypothetical protein
VQVPWTATGKAVVLVPRESITTAVLTLTAAASPAHDAAIMLMLRRGRLLDARDWASGT